MLVCYGQTHVLLVSIVNCCRALDSFKSLLQEKAHCLAHPDVLISAVGTKIYNYTPDAGWQEDMGWSKQLDQGWKVAAVRDAAYAALAQVHVTEMCWMLLVRGPRDSKTGWECCYGTCYNCTWTRHQQFTRAA